MLRCVRSKFGVYVEKILHCDYDFFLVIGWDHLLYNIVWMVTLSQGDYRRWNRVFNNLMQLCIKLKSALKMFTAVKIIYKVYVFISLHINEN